MSEIELALVFSALEREETLLESRDFSSRSSRSSIYFYDPRRKPQDPLAESSIYRGMQLVQA